MSINKLIKELDIIKNYKSPEGFEIITEANKRIYSYEVDKIISNCQLRESNMNREGNVVTKLMMDSLFNNGVIMMNHHRLPTELLIGFEDLMEVSIDLVKKYDLVQCEVPMSKCKTKELRGNISAASCKKHQKFDIFDAYKQNLYNHNIDSFMKKMKYIFTVMPYSQVDIDIYTTVSTERRGFYITCA